MSLSQYAQSVIALKQSALPPSAEFAEILNDVKKSIHSGNTMHPTSAIHTDKKPVNDSGMFRSFGNSRGGGGGNNRNYNSGNNRNYNNENNNNGNYHSRNGFRREAPSPQYNNVYSHHNRDDQPKSIPIKTESDGWTTVANKGNPGKTVTRVASSGLQPVYRTATRTPSNKPKEEVILNNVILGKLNKFSDANFDEIKEFLQQILDGDQKDFLRAFMKLIFQKAAMESTFCPLYAKLLGSLVDKYPLLLEEMNILHSKYLEIFSGVASPKTDNYDDFVEENKKKAYRLGYSQFLGELIKFDIISRDVLFTMVGSILSKVRSIENQEGQNELVDEYTDCLVKLIRAFTERGMTPLREEMFTEFSGTIEILASRRSDAQSICAKARFGFMDCLDILKKK